MIKKRLYLLLGGIFILIIVLFVILRVYEKINSVDCVLLVGATATICLLIGFILEGMTKASKDQAKIHYNMCSKISSHILSIRDFLSYLSERHTEFYDNFKTYLLDTNFDNFEYSQIESEYPEFKKNTLEHNEQIEKLKDNYQKIKDEINKLESKISEIYYHPRFISTENFCLILTNNIEKIDREEKKETQIWMERLEKSEFEKEIKLIKKRINSYEDLERKISMLASKHLKKLEEINKKWLKEYEPYKYL